MSPPPISGTRTPRTTPRPGSAPVVPMETVWMVVRPLPSSAARVLPEDLQGWIERRGQLLGLTLVVLLPPEAPVGTLLVQLITPLPAQVRDVWMNLRANYEVGFVVGEIGVP